MERSDPWVKDNSPEFVRALPPPKPIGGYRLTESAAFPLHSSYLDGARQARGASWP